jgi:tetratricopeptide (TPR) repeat protein
MASKKTTWAAFPVSNKAFIYDGIKLSKAWKTLHLGDGEPFPDARRAQALLKAAARHAPPLDATELSEQLQCAWRAFHAGEFQQAFELGSSLGVIGSSVATKALGIHSNYLVKKTEDKLHRFEQLAVLAEQAIAALPNEANSYYRMAFGYGRYSQGISIGKALKMGLAGKVKIALDSCLNLNPKHAEAHLASALWHAEIVHKVGSMLAGFTYGAKQRLAEEHMKTALKLAPDMPIVHSEHAQMLLLLDERGNAQAAADAFERATKLTAMDAMDYLDAHFAQTQIC